MANVNMQINVTTSGLEEMTAQVEKLVRFFDAADDSDPLKQLFAEFGEIEPDSDIIKTVSGDGLHLHANLSWRPELQVLFDQLDALT